MWLVSIKNAKKSNSDTTWEFVLSIIWLRLRNRTRRFAIEISVNSSCWIMWDIFLRWRPIGDAIFGLSIRTHSEGWANRMMFSIKQFSYGFYINRKWHYSKKRKKNPWQCCKILFSLVRTLLMFTMWSRNFRHFYFSTNVECKTMTLICSSTSFSTSPHKNK